MKNIFYLLLIVLVFSCSNKSERKYISNEVSESKSVVSMSSFENEVQTKQKLQDYFDLLVLQNKNPEFKEDILKQLQKISSINKTITDTNTVKIENLKRIGTIEKITDTIQKMKIVFDVKTSKNTKKDTIIVVILTKIIKIDGKTFVSNKIKFEE